MSATFRQARRQAQQMGFDPATGALLPTAAAEADAGAASKPEAKGEEKGAGEQVTIH